MSIGEKIKKLRVGRGLTQKKLGIKMGVAESTISLYESNDRTPDIDMLKKYAEYFKVSTDYLLGLVDKPHRIIVPELIDLGVEWVEVAKKCVSTGLSPEVIAELIDVINRQKEV